MNKTVIKYPFKSELKIEFEIISLKALYNRSRQMLIKPHRASFYHIIWFKSKPAIHLVDFSPIHIEKNTILFLNKDIVQLYEDKSEIDGIVILFTDTFFCKDESDVKYLNNNILFNDLQSVVTIQVNTQQKIFDQLIKLMETEMSVPSDLLQVDILRNHLSNFLLHAERIRRAKGFKEFKKGADLDYVVLFKDMLERDFKKNKQVTHFTGEISVTEKRLNQATTKVLGITPKQMIDVRVMLEAKRLLAHTNQTIKEIGYSLGYDEPTNFIKFFRKHSLQTPVEFRESLNFQ